MTNVPAKTTITSQYCHITLREQLLVEVIVVNSVYVDLCIDAIKGI